MLDGTLAYVAADIIVDGDRYLNHRAYPSHSTVGTQFGSNYGTTYKFSDAPHDECICSFWMPCYCGEREAA